LTYSKYNVPTRKKAANFCTQYIYRGGKERSFGKKSWKNRKGDGKEKEKEVGEVGTEVHRKVREKRNVKILI
jgi:hypothetical protein